MHVYPIAWFLPSYSKNLGYLFLRKSSKNSYAILTYIVSRIYIEWVSNINLLDSSRNTIWLNFYYEHLHTEHLFFPYLYTYLILCLFCHIFRMKVPFSLNMYLLDNSQCYEVENVILEKDLKDKVNFEAPWNNVFNPCIIKGETHN